MHPVKTAGRILGAGLVLLLWTVSGVADPGPGFPAKVQVADRKINDDTGTANQYEPSLAMHRGALTLVAWPDGRNGTTDIYSQLYNRNGQPFGTLGNVKVNDASHDDVLQNCDVAMDGYGHSLVAWDGGIGSESHVYGQWVYANGRPKGGNFRIDEGAGAVPNGGVALAGVDSGGAVAVWSDYRHSMAGELMLQVYGRDTNPSGSPVRINPGSVHSSLYAAIDVSPRGNGWVVWQDMPAVGGGRIMASLFDIRTGHAGIPFEVAPKDDASATNCMAPVVAAGPDGAATVFWMTDYGDGVIRRRACLYDSGGTPVVGPFFVDEDDKFGFQGELSVCRLDDGHSIFLWSGNVAGDWNIYIRTCDAAGVLAAPSTPVNDTPGLQFGPDIATDGSGIIQMVWYDRRSGTDFDVYGTRLKLDAPASVTAGSGFDGLVPVSWEAPFDGGHPVRYQVHRMDVEAGTISELATVDVSGRLLPNRMLDFIDATAENGRSYAYAVRTDEPGAMHAWSGIVTPAAGGHAVASAWCDARPGVNGDLALGEWMTATEVDISEPTGHAEVSLFVMNDADSLYLAVIDRTDQAAEAATTCGILLDLNHNGAWPSAGPSTEGLLAFTPAGAGFQGYWGAYPDGLGGDAALPAPFMNTAISHVRETVQYECAVPILDPPLSFSPGGTVGFSIAVSDPGNFYAYHYGYAGEWPRGALWEAAETLGHLTLASGPDGVNAEPDLPSGFGLGRNYPNPFNPVTTVPFRIGRAGRVTLKVYDALGNEVAVLADGRYEAGSQTVRFNAAGLASGVYVVRMQADGFTASRKIAVVK